MRGILIRWVIIALAFAVTAWLLGGVTVSGGVWGYIWVSALFGIINVFLGTILRLISLPLTVITLGLFLIVINAILLRPLPYPQAERLVFLTEWSEQVPEMSFSVANL